MILGKTVCLVVPSFNLFLHRTRQWHLHSPNATLGKKRENKNYPVCVVLAQSQVPGPGDDEGPGQ